MRLLDPSGADPHSTSVLWIYARPSYQMPRLVGGISDQLNYPIPAEGDMQDGRYRTLTEQARRSHSRSLRPRPTWTDRPWLSGTESGSTGRCPNAGTVWSVSPTQPCPRAKAESAQRITRR